MFSSSIKPLGRLLALSMVLFGSISAVYADEPPSQQAEQAQATTNGAAPAQDVADGPLIEARKMLWSRINQAKAEGIGTGAYVNAFKGIEDEIRAGKGAEDVRPRIESLARSLKDQLDRSKILKTQRPIPPTPSQMVGSAPGGGPPAPRGGGLDGLAAKLGGKDPNALIEKLKQKLNSGDIPDAVKDQLLNSDKGKKIIEKLSQ